jgi:hypothetical protein
MITISVAGLFCYCMACIMVPPNSTVILTDNDTFIMEKCMGDITLENNIEGCALLEENTVVVRKGEPNRTNWVIFHELLHLEMGREHTNEFLDREMDAVICIYSGRLMD